VLFPTAPAELICVGRAYELGKLELFIVQTLKSGSAHRAEKIVAGRSVIAKAWAQACLGVVLLNALFFFLALFSASAPSGRVASAARLAFETGALTGDDWLIADQKRGNNQYNDCLIIQLIVNDVSLFDDALAPLIGNNSTWTASCATLRGIVFDRGTDSKASGFRYTRYWHGYVPVATLLLSLIDLDAARTLLKFSVYLSLLILAMSALRTSSTEVRIFAYSIVGTTAFFWSIPYFGQSLSHAPGDAFLMLGLAGFLFFSEDMSVGRALIPYSAAYGAGVAYLEFWTGQLPTAVGFLFTATYVVSVARSADSHRLIAAWITALISVLAFLTGAALTVASKQMLAILFTDAPVLASFAEALSHYSGTALSNGSSASSGGRLSSFLLLLRSGTTLTYWSGPAAIGLGIGVMGTWCGAALLTWFCRTGRPRAISNLLAYAAGSLVPFGWAAIFYVHTAIHAGFMSRMLILPVAFGTASFFNCVAALNLGTKSLVNDP